MHKTIVLSVVLLLGGCGWLVGGSHWETGDTYWFDTGETGVDDTDPGDTDDTDVASENCRNGVDDDGDGRVDCDDSDCADHWACEEDEPSGQILIDVEWPFLEMAGLSEKVYPTFLAHMQGTNASASWWDGDFAYLSIDNDTASSISLEVNAVLSGFSTADTDLINLSAGQSTTVVLNPQPDLDALYALNAETSGQASVEVRNSSTNALVAEEDVSVRVAAKGDWFSGMALDSIGALVTPNSDGVVDLLDDIAGYSWFGSFGVGGYRADAGTEWWPTFSTSVSAGSWSSTSMFVQQGRSVSIQADSNGSDSLAWLMDATEYNNFLNGASPLVYWQTEIDSTQQTTFTAPATGWYYLVFKNDSFILSETISWSRTMTRADNVLDYLQAIYSYLQDLGINYINLLSNSFDYSQRVLLPDEVIGNGGGNCIDGTVLFAALLEKIGVNPVVTLVPGHAFISVEDAPGASSLDWPVETTMLGSGASFSEAWSAGITQYNEESSAGTLTRVPLDEVRADGIMEMPR